MVANIDYNTFEENRVRTTNAILNSTSNKKIILAGPGTGKSHIFKEICNKIISDNPRAKIIALSFTNELVNDLEKELYKLAEVHTLHRFALKLLSVDSEISGYHLNIDKIIAEDYVLLQDINIDYNEMFSNQVPNEAAIQFYFERQSYYKFYGPNSSIHTIIRNFEENPDIIPTYDQILIDEYQDFTKLEIKLIQILSTKSPILIVGDDDQSVYSFKYAKPEEIRNCSTAEEFTSFQLPYCSRCTRVIIDAYNNFIACAIEEGFLKDRVNKSFEYFPSKEKDIVTECNPQIVSKQVYERQLSYNIDQQIKKLVSPSDKNNKFLIICPTNPQIKNLNKNLFKKGYRNIDLKIRDNYNDELASGFRLILKNINCNLGWRILAKYFYDLTGRINEFNALITRSTQGEKFLQLLNSDDKRNIKKIRAILNKIKNNETLINDEIEQIVDCFKVEINKLVTEHIDQQFFKKIPSINVHKDISIKITTLLGSKGLTSDYVFLVNFDDRFILDNNSVTDESIRRFLVVLTRARKRLFIYRNQPNLPKYLEWIPRGLLNLE